MAAKLQYNKEYHLDWAWSLYIRGATDEEVADAFHVSKRTILRWAKQYEEFREVREESKEKADAKVEKSLYVRATGYDYTTSDTVVEVDAMGNPGNSRIRTFKHHEPPDVGAIAFWLKNRRPNDWRDRREPEPDTEIMKKADEIMIKIRNAAQEDGENDGNNSVEETG